ncbi:MAG: tetratricopeptide repeat protein [Stygiobacter sp.]
MKTKFLIIVLFLSATINFSQSRIRLLANEGMEQAYNFQLVQAEKTFEKIINQYPNSPEGYYRTALLHFWIYIGSRDPGEYQVFIKFADLAQQKIDKLLDKYPKNFYTNYIAGNLFLFRSMAQATNGQSVDAFWSSKNAVNYLEESLKLKPNFYDSYLGLGLLDYAMSFVPDFLKWAVNLTGLSSDKNRGFKYIKTAYKRGTYTKTEAEFHLSKIYTDYLSEYDSAYTLLQNLITKYPNNTLFSYQYAVSLIKGKNLERANSVLNNVIRLKNKKIPQITALAYYRKGEIYFKRNNFKEAIKNYKVFFDLSRELDLTGIAALNTAIAYKILDKDEEFKQYLSLAKNGNQDIFEDAYALKKAEHYLEHGITDEELFLYKIKNNLEAGNYRYVYNALTNSKENFSHDLAALKLIYLAEAELKIGKVKQSIKTCNEIFDLNIHNEKWIYAMANLITANAYFHLGSKVEAKEYLAKAEAENDHDFKDYIQSKIEYLKRRIK